LSGLAVKPVIVNPFTRAVSTKEIVYNPIVIAKLMRRRNKYTGTENAQQQQQRRGKS
jgi:hypothetical protein